MDPQRWQRITELFERAIELPAGDRATFLAGECGSDLDLQAELGRMLGGAARAAASLRGIVASEIRHIERPTFSTARRAQASLPARLADRFEIRRQLGAGGMGVVFEAYDEQRRELVAVKVLERRDPRHVYQLKREFRALADLVHPHLVRLHELFADGEHWFFTMEKVDGVAFLDHVRRHATIDERALRSALRGLVDGVCAIHRAGRLHRDLKPSNVLVANGRTVILDFGLATPITDAGEIAGTPPYMAPELLAGRASTAGDWYAVGVMLYEALAGARPFAPLGGPPDLVSLATRLIARDPADRPDAAAIVTVIWPDGDGVVSAPAPSPHDDVFVGRHDELAILEEAFGKTTPVLVQIDGPSGIGKSALVERFLDNHRDAVVLRGRCHERENMPFNALDEIVDAIARRLRHAAEPPVLEYVADLCRVFPVLGGVCEPRSPATTDPQLARSRAFAALADLLRYAARGGRLVIAIDDLQWSGADSAVMLRALLESRVPALWIASYRSGVSDVLSAIDDLPIETYAITLRPLDDQAARELVYTLWPEAGEHAAVVASDSGGNPFFLRELAQSAGAGGARPATLAALVQHRVDLLEEQARRLLETVAIAGMPVTLTSALSAAGLASDAPVPDLRARSLVRTHVVERRVAIEPYHDKIREAVVASLAAPDRRAHHRALANALELEHAPAAVLAHHFAACGERAPARRYTIEAAHAAVRGLAFDRAADLYQKAIELAAPEPARELERARGDALANGGRGPEAAEAYLRAAKGADASDAIDLARRAAHQYLTTGHLERGRAIGWDVILRLGMWIPRSPLAAQLITFARFVWLLVRGFGPPRGRLVDDPVAVRRYDVANELFQDLASHEVMHATYFTVSASLRGVRLVDPSRRADAIGSAAAFMCVVRGRSDRRIDRWLDEQRTIAAQVGSPTALAVASTFDGVCAGYTGAWRRASEHFADAEKWFAQSDSIKVRFQLSTMQALDTWVLFYRGELVELGRRARRRLAEAKTRHNAMAANAQSTNVSIAAWLADDDVVGAAREVAAAARRLPTDVYGMQHTWLLLARSMVALYTRDAVAGHARMVVEAPAIERSRLLGVKVARMVYLVTRAALALAAADELGPNPRANQLRREAGALARRLARIPVAGSRALALLLRAALAPDPTTILDEARRALAQAGMLGYAHAAGWHLGGEARHAAEEFFAAQQIARPDRFVAMLAPGLAHVE